MELTWMTIIDGVKILNIVTSDDLFDFIEIEFYRSINEKYNFLYISIDVILTESLNNILLDIGNYNVINTCIWNESKTKNISSDDSSLWKRRLKFEDYMSNKRVSLDSLGRNIKYISDSEYKKLENTFMTRVYSYDERKKNEIYTIEFIEEKVCSEYTPVLCLL
jgi:hypothetical protein